VYPIRSGVPRLLSDGQHHADRQPAAGQGQGRTRECYSYLWRFKAERLGWQHQADHERDLFLRNMAVAADELRGRALLDAGCGDGRFASSLAGLGLETIGLDLSEGVEIGHRNNHDPLVHYVQGDLLAPPLRRHGFDFVWSFGVLHHTADARRGFEECAALVRPSGRLFVWLYDRAPENRAAVIRLSQRAPLAVKRLVSRAFQIGNTVKRSLGVGNPVTRAQTRDEVYFWNLDMYGPAHRSLQSAGEVQDWFESLGFENVVSRERMDFGFGMTGDLPAQPKHAQALQHLAAART
jgi:SAM-dependent methyltransferase